MSKNKILYTETKQVVDVETGELHTTETTNVVRLEREPPYVKMYLDDLSKLIGLQSGATMVLHELVSKIDYDGIVTITKGTRERIAKKLNMKESSVRNRISDLTKENVLRRTGYCEYEMNPHLFAKGEWNDIRKRRSNFKLEITYTEQNERHLEATFID